MEQVIKEIGIQVPSVLLVVYFSLQVIKLILNEQGKKIERLADAVEKLVNKN